MVEGQEMTSDSAKVAQETSRAQEKPKRSAAALLLPLFSILFTFLLLEGGMRLAIGMKIDYFLNPALYTYPFTDDYWKLIHQWDERATDGTSENVNPDPFLGWSPPKSSENPLGLMGHEPYTPDPTAPAILFYGDSFVAGKTAAAEDNVPRQLATHLGDTAVYNYGVSNFGVDQIYLRFHETHSTFEQPTIVIGIFTLDMDRSLLSLRSSAPKPRFEVGENDELILHGIDHVAFNGSVADWISSWHEQNPPQIRSFVWSFLMRRLDNFRTGDDWMNSTLPQAELEQLNGLLIDEMVAEAKANDLPIQFVIFYTRRELDQTYWRETFLLNRLEALGVPYLDTKPLIMETAVSESRDLWDYYFDDGGHTNELGNAVIAEALATQLNAASGDE
ncbi:MAG: SGNH/GDSL hydrolase family protein [Chloroflexi bacterium]|nr:SGNH/GDSL hydrolase family protein [Chloroflexota bacterium]